MRIDLGLVLGVAIEFILFLYYANTTLYPKKNYYVSSAIALVGYVLIFAISIFAQAILNAIAFISINLIIFLFGYQISFKNAIFRSAMLTILIFLGEIMLAFILEIGLSTQDILNISFEKSMIITIAGKLIYFIGIIVIKMLTHKKDSHSENSFIVLILVPIATFICLFMVLNIDVEKQIFVILCIIF